jgi:CubicO group peptidase (beta-lactamase class C family)
LESKNLDAFLSSTAEELGIPGQSCAVMINDELVYEKYMGYADLETNRMIAPDTVFRIYSMTKLFTVTAAMQLYEQGKFDILDPVAKYLPEFSDVKMYTTSDSGVRTAVPLKRPLRILDLLTCTGGFTYFTEKKGSSGSSNASAVLTASTQTAIDLAEIMFELEMEYPGKTFSNRDFTKAVSRIPLAFQPGSHWMYGMNFEVLGAVVEVLSGKTLDVCIEENICAPLGLKDTSFHLNPDMEERLCSYYNISDKANPVKFTNKDDYYQPQAKFVRGGGGMLSTLSEFMRFANTLQRGGTSPDGVRILGRKTVELMSSNHLGEAQIKDITWPSLAGYGYGFGCRVLMDKSTGGSTSSVGEWGWSGSAGTWMACDPQEKLTVCLMKQVFPAYEGWIVPRFKPVLWGSL